MCRTRIHTHARTHTYTPLIFLRTSVYDADISLKQRYRQELGNIKHTSLLNGSNIAGVVHKGAVPLQFSSQDDVSSFTLCRM